MRRHRRCRKRPRRAEGGLRREAGKFGMRLDEHPVRQPRTVGALQDVPLDVHSRIGPAGVKGDVRVSAIVERAQIIAHVVHPHRIALVVARSVAPAVNDIVPEIEQRIARTRISALVERVDVVMHAHVAGRRNQRAVSVLALAMHRFVQTLGDEAPLDGDVRRVADHADGFVRRPARRTVIHDNVG